MENTNLEKFLKILEMAEDFVSSSDFAKVIHEMLDGLEEFKKETEKNTEKIDEELTKKIDGFISVCERQLQNMAEVGQENVQEFKNELNNSLQKISEEFNKELSEIELTPGEDGKDAELTEEIKGEIIDKIMYELRGKWTPALKSEVKKAVDEAVKNIKPNTTFIGGGIGAPFEVAIKAGLNVSVRKDASGAYVISALGGSSDNFADNEVAAGSGTSFTLAHTPVVGSEHVYANGQRLTPTVDYSITGANITTGLSWDAGVILVDYRY